MIYSNFSQPLFPIDGIGYHAIRLGEEFEAVEFRCKSPYIALEPGLNQNLNFQYDKKSAQFFLKEYEEDWRNVEDPRWNIPEELYLLLKTRNTSTTFLGISMLQAWKFDKKDYGLKVLKRFHLTNRQERNFSVGIMAKLTGPTALVRVFYSGIAKLETSYILCHEGRVNEFTEKSPVFNQYLSELKINIHEIWKDRWEVI